jgi:site-specific recombinase XerD
MRERTSGGRHPRAAARLTSYLVEEFLLAKEASGRRPDTIECYRTRLRRLVEFLSDPDIASIRSADIRRWLVFLKLGRVRTTTGIYVDGHRIVASTFFAWLVRYGVLKRSPMDGVDRFLVDRPAVRALTRDQIQLLLKSQRGLRTGLRNRVMLAFMYDTGIRLAELTRMRLEDVDLSARLARIESKTRSLDVVPLSRALCKELEAYLSNDRAPSPEGTDALFTRHAVPGSGRPVGPLCLRLSRRQSGVRVPDGDRDAVHVLRVPTHLPVSQEALRPPEVLRAHPAAYRVIELHARRDGKRA